MKTKPHLDLNTERGSKNYDRQLRYQKRKEARKTKKRLLARV
jgi:hypothetical protein